MVLLTSSGPAGFAAMLFAVPLVYFVLAYAYLVRWHGKLWLMNTIVHENGRLTLLESLFYFDHFVSHIPMIAIFALCAAGGMAITERIPLAVGISHRASHLAGVMLGAALCLAAISFLGALLTVGWQRTLDYCLQRIERDGIMSPGGLWNQLQLSNVPIALGTVGLGLAIQRSVPHSQFTRDAGLSTAGIILVSLAVAIMAGMSLFTWQSWAALRNPRWLAHSMREVATFPLTGVPIALAATVLVQSALGSEGVWSMRISNLSAVLLGFAALIVATELIIIRNVRILSIAQRPAFAGERMTVLYLLASHVFEHALDFVFMGLLAGGAYALACRALSM